MGADQPDDPPPPPTTHIRQLINQPLRINQSVRHRVALRVRINYTRVDSDFQKMQIRIRILRAKILQKNMPKRFDICIIFYYLSY